MVLGYELLNGGMTDELKGRCDAAAAAAKTFPASLLVCSGGATGQNNPQRHTEAGLMKDYLVDECGIAAERVFTDERALTTAENIISILDEGCSANELCYRCGNVEHCKKERSGKCF